MVGDRVSNGYALGSRVAVQKRTEDFKAPNKLARALHIPSRVFGRSSTSTSSSGSSEATCSDSRASNTCEKPASINTNFAIVISVVIPIVVAICVLFYLHRRSVQRQRREDAKDVHKSLDFGMGEGSTKGSTNSKRKSPLGGEKRPRGMSMDMNLSSPYLLPAGMQGSRDSLNSLAKTLQNNDADPYRPIASYMNDTGSVRSFEKGGKGTPSVYTNSTYRPSRQSQQSSGTMSPITAGPNGPNAPLRNNSYPKSPLTPSATSSMTIVESVDDVAMPQPAAAKEYFEPHQATIPQIDSVPQPPVPAFPTVQQPAPVAQRGQAQESTAPVLSGEIHEEPAVGLGLFPNPQNANLATEHVTSPTHHSVTPVIENSTDYYDYDYPIMPEAPDADEDDGRGRSRVRESGLALPQQDSRRLSVGFRPLPPDDATSSEDPETRANRIRSFYKEYFDPDSQPAPPMPGQYGGDHMPDGAYFDPDSNQFVMPYAQPVTRRAMTPPPSGSRFPGNGPRGHGGPRGPGPMGPSGPRGPGGPRGPPRGHSGSISGMSMPRAGSSMSAYGPRPGSSASGQPRSGSAMSSKPRKPMPPPSALTTLPTPSKLKDDDSFLINAADFAPPVNYSDRVAGRSQSPLGERRAYQPKVPVASPLVSAFDEMASMPSPHMLRKSSTFTGLDFAPPRKFHDGDNQSDAGSIRSNRSGISQVQLGAIRNGAGRVSRLPGDAVFTAHDLNEQLKPTWNMGRDKMGGPTGPGGN